MSKLLSYAYRAMQLDGKTRNGQMMASSEAEVFAKLRLESLTPVSIVHRHEASADGGLRPGRWWPRRSGLSNADLEELLQSLAVLLRAGADIRTALAVLSTDDGIVKDVSQRILSGASLDTALGHVIPPSLTHLRGLIAAGEARGDLATGLEGAAGVLATRRRIRQQLFEALSYPAFVFMTAVAALTIVLLVVVPAIAPLLQDSGQIPIYFSVIIFLSQSLQAGWPFLFGGACLIGGIAYLGWRFGGLRRWLDVWMLDGALRGVTRPLIFGGYAKTLGDSLDAGASLSEGLRLCQRSIGNAEAKQRLDVIINHIRQGRPLSESFKQVKGFPKQVIRLCEVGEASSSLGRMLSRAGEREETAALSRIDKYAKLLGPLLIMVLGAMIGALMAGVLTALTDIGSVSGG